MQLCAGLSTLQQAASLGYPSTVYTDRPRESKCRLPPWAWLVVAVAAVSLLVAGEASPDQFVHDSSATSTSVGILGLNTVLGRAYTGRPSQGPFPAH